MSALRDAWRHFRERWYFIPMTVFVGLVFIWCAAWLLDPRKDFDVTLVNTGKDDVTKGRAQLDDDWYVGGGALRYSYGKSESGHFETPPKIARVFWQKGDQRFDRTVAILGRIPNTLYPQLLIEINSDCNRVQAIWMSDPSEVFAATPYKYVPKDCSIYADGPTPSDAPPWPANW